MVSLESIYPDRWNEPREDLMKEIGIRLEGDEFVTVSCGGENSENLTQGQIEDEYRVVLITANRAIPSRGDTGTLGTVARYNGVVDVDDILPFYFEITLNEFEEEVFIGFIPEDALSEDDIKEVGAFPGYLEDSVGVRIGKRQLVLFQEGSPLLTWAKDIARNDVVGCGINVFEGEGNIFFTVNGEIINKDHRIRVSGLYTMVPAISIGIDGGKVEGNFGMSGKSFVFKGDGLYENPEIAYLDAADDAELKLRNLLMEKSLDNEIKNQMFICEAWLQHHTVKLETCLENDEMALTERIFAIIEKLQETIKDGNDQLSKIESNLNEQRVLDNILTLLFNVRETKVDSDESDKSMKMIIQYIRTFGGGNPAGILAKASQMTKQGLKDLIKECIISQNEEESNEPLPRAVLIDVLKWIQLNKSLPLMSSIVLFAIFCEELGDREARQRLIKFFEEVTDESSTRETIDEIGILSVLGNGSPISICTLGLKETLLELVKAGLKILTDSGRRTHIDPLTESGRSMHMDVHAHGEVERIKDGHNIMNDEYAAAANF